MYLSEQEFAQYIGVDLVTLHELRFIEFYPKAHQRYHISDIQYFASNTELYKITGKDYDTANTKYGTLRPEEELAYSQIIRQAKEQILDQLQQE